MDISWLLAFDDPRLANQYYLVVSPLNALFLFGLVMLPWLGAWLGGLRGLAWIVAMQVLCVIGVNVAVRFQTFGSEQFATDLGMLIARLSVVQLLLIAASALAAKAWLKRS